MAVKQIELIGEIEQAKDEYFELQEEVIFSCSIQEEVIFSCSVQEEVIFSCSELILVIVLDGLYA